MERCFQAHVTTLAVKKQPWTSQGPSDGAEENPSSRSHPERAFPSPLPSAEREGRPPAPARPLSHPKGGAGFVPSLPSDPCGSNPTMPDLLLPPPVSPCPPQEGLCIEDRGGFAPSHTSSQPTPAICEGTHEPSTTFCQPRALPPALPPQNFSG